MKPWGTVALAVGVLAAGIVTYFVTRPEGDYRTDAQAEQLAERLGYPWKDDAASYGRHTLSGADSQHKVVAWYPRKVHVQPGESSCDGTAALGFYRTPPR